MLLSNVLGVLLRLFAGVDFLNLAVFLPYKCEFNIQFYEKVFGYIVVGPCAFVVL